MCGSSFEDPTDNRTPSFTAAHIYSVSRDLRCAVMLEVVNVKLGAISLILNSVKWKKFSSERIRSLNGRL